MAHRMSQDAITTPISLLNGVADETGFLDIGGTNGSTPWLDMQDFDRIYAYVKLGAWNATDDLDECRLEQATSSAGAGAKDLTADGAASTGYDTDTPIDAKGDQVILEARAEDMDWDAGFRYVRLYLAEGGNTGVDSVFGFVQRYSTAYKKKRLQGAAAAGSLVYSTPQGNG